MTDKIEIKKLKFFDLGKEGGLFETLRADDLLYKGKFGQNLVSLVNSGIIKGFHLHHKQTEYTTCIKGNILYITITEEKDSPLIQKFIIGEQNRILIKTPPGIWHGYTPLDNKETVVLYTMDSLYNPKDTDTEEKDPYAFGGIWTP